MTVGHKCLDKLSLPEEFCGLVNTIVNGPKYVLLLNIGFIFMGYCLYFLARIY